MDYVDFAETFRRLASENASETSQTIGGVQVRLVRVAAGSAGEWGRHPTTTETVVVWSGDFTVDFRDQVLRLGPGQCGVVPVNAEHQGSSVAGAEIVLFQNC